MDLGDEIRRSWDVNAAAWVSAVREDAISSRAAGTNAAIVEAVGPTRPCRVLDVGCGEGWLARELARSGCQVIGFDGSVELIGRAKEQHDARFLQINYAQLICDPALIDGAFDRIVCNYSLFEENITALLGVLLSMLAPQGRILIQTLHPSRALATSEGYMSGWRTETFETMGDGFRSSMPYYFRTFARWCSELHDAGLILSRCSEPVSSESGMPLSLILIAEKGTRHD